MRCFVSPPVSQGDYQNTRVVSLAKLYFRLQAASKHLDEHKTSVSRIRVRSNLPTYLEATLARMNGRIGSTGAQGGRTTGEYGDVTECWCGNPDASFRMVQYLPPTDLSSLLTGYMHAIFWCQLTPSSGFRLSVMLRDRPSPAGSYVRSHVW